MPGPRVRAQFTDAELEAVRDAARDVETRSRGEIVAVVVDRCDPYDGARWKAAALGAMLTALGAAAWHAAGGWWGVTPFVWIALPAGAGAALGALAATLVPPLHRALAGRATMDRHVARRAAAALMEEKVTSTRDRSGVLVMLALFEHRVEIVADVGLRDRVDAGARRPVADELAAAARRGRPGPALREAVIACGRILDDAGVTRRPDDDNELSDDVRLRDA